MVLPMFQDIFEEFHLQGLVSKADLSLIEGNKEMQKEISYYDNDAAFDDLPIADHFLGVLVFTPKELLHLLQLGIVPLTLTDIMRHLLKSLVLN